MEGRVDSDGFQAGGARGVVFVADVLLPRPPADGKPFKASPDRLDEIPGIESIHQGFFAKAAALVCGLRVHEEPGTGFSSDDVGATDVVFLPGKGE